MHEVAHVFPAVDGLAEHPSRPTGAESERIKALFSTEASAELRAVFDEWYVQEQRAQRATAALDRISTDSSRTLRNGALREELTTELVPGDVVELVAGDVISADVRLADVRGLRVNEAALTGESEPVRMCCPTPSMRSNVTCILSESSAWQTRPVPRPLKPSRPVAARESRR